MTNKIIYLFSISLFFINVNLYSQFIPSMINFTDVKPDWTYISIDTTFVKNPSDPYSSPYSNRALYGFALLKESLLLVERSYSQNPYLGPAGVTIHRLSKSTGKPIWSHHWNEFVGLKHREEHSFFNFFANDDDRSILLGSCRDKDTMNFATPGLFFSCLPALREIDMTSGMLLEQKNNNQDSILSGYGGGSALSRIVLNKKNEVFFISVDTSNSDTAIVNELIIQPLNEKFEYDVSLQQVVKDTSTVPRELPQLNNLPYYFQKDENTLIAFFVDNDVTSSENSPKRYSFSLIDISDKNSIIQYKKENVNKYLIYPQSSPYIYIYPTKSGFTLGQILKNENEQQYFYFRLISYDGNLIGSTDKLILNDIQYHFIIPIAEHNGSFYMFGIYKLGNRNKHNLLKMDLENGSISFVKEIKYNNPSSVDIEAANFSRMDEKGNLYCAFKCTQIVNNNRMPYIQYCKFKAEDLGIRTEVSYENINDNVFLFPNPVTKELHIKSDYKINKLTIYNAEGLKIMQTKEVADLLDVSHLAPSIYIIEFTLTNNMKLSKKFIKI